MQAEITGKAITVQNARDHDMDDIMVVLVSNASEPALYKRSAQDICRSLPDFLVAKNSSDQILGCAAVHQNTEEWVELLSVAVKPESQRHGIGQMLVKHAILKAATLKSKYLWLTTTRPRYFVRFGFQTTTMSKLPLLLWPSMIHRVFHQPVKRWSLVSSGSFTFMRMFLGNSTCRPISSSTGSAGHHEE